MKQSYYGQLFLTSRDSELEIHLATTRELAQAGHSDIVLSFRYAEGPDVKTVIDHLVNDFGLGIVKLHCDIDVSVFILFSNEDLAESDRLNHDVYASYEEGVQVPNWILDDCKKVFTSEVNGVRFCERKYHGHKLVLTLCDTP